MVKWHNRSDGTVLEDSEVSGLEFRKYAADFLFDYYESHLKFNN